VKDRLYVLLYLTALLGYRESNAKFTETLHALEKAWQRFLKERHCRLRE
jgi:hypothetical protein